MSESAFLASSLSQATAGGRMQFRLPQNNGSWTAPALIAPGAAPVGGEGKPALAARPKGPQACPGTDEVYAMWLRGTRADPFSLATEVWGAGFVNGAWQTAQRVAKRQWLRPAAARDLPQRHPGAELRTPTAAQPERGWPAPVDAAAGGVDAQPLDADAAPGVIWQDIGSNALGQLVLGYTMAIGADAVIGNQARLHAARGSCDGSGCSFIHPRQHDGSGHDIRAESARVVLLEAATEDPWAEPNGLLRLRVLIEIRGPQLRGLVALGASWCGPWDSGVAQQHFDLPPFGDSASQLLDLEVQVPAELSGR